MGDVKWVHFMTDVEDLGAAYRCERCGHSTATKVGMYDHRSGLFGPCVRRIILQELTDYYSSVREWTPNVF